MTAPSQTEKPFPIRRTFWSIVAAAFGYRTFLLLYFPTVYSWDAFTRLLDPGRLLVRHWMPIPQVPIYFADLLGADIISVRLSYALIGTAAVALIGAFALRTQGPRAGLITMAIAATLPGFVIYTIVPYQEGVLLFLLFAFLCLFKLDPSEMSPVARSAAAAALGLACLCRYEAWIFAGLFALRPIAKRRVADLWIFAPSVFAIGWWLLILPTLDQTNPMAAPFETPFPESTEAAFAAMTKAIRLGFAGMQWVGLPLAALGACVAYRRGGLLGREILAFSVLIAALTLFRALYSAQATTRMTVLPLVIATLYVPAGLGLLSEWKPIPHRMRRASEIVVVAALIAAFGYTTYDSLRDTRRRYRDEKSIANYLQKVVSQEAPNVRIGIVPREIKNVWGESSVKAIFGQAMSLRVDDPRWSLGRERVVAERASLGRVLLFDPDTDRYRVVSPNDPALGALYSTR